METDKDIGLRIKRLREELHKNPTQFSADISVPRTTLLGWEGGKAVPFETILKITKAFENINLGWLVYGEGPMFLDEIRHSVVFDGKTETVSVLKPGNEPDFPVGDDKYEPGSHLLPDHPPSDHHQETSPKGLLEPSGRGPAPIRVVHPEEIAGNHFLVPLLDQQVSAGYGADLPDEDKPSSYIPAPAYLSRYGRDVAALHVRGDSMEPTLKDGDLVVCDTHGWQGDGIYVIQMDGEGFVKRLTRRPGRLVVISDNTVYHPYEESLESQALRVVGRVRCAVRKME